MHDAREHDRDMDTSKSSTEPDPRDPDVRDAEDLDPHSGVSDDPRVDPTPDRRQSDTTTPS